MFVVGGTKVTECEINAARVFGKPKAARELPVLKFIKGLSPSLHTVQIASYGEMNPIIRKIT